MNLSVPSTSRIAQGGNSWVGNATLQTPSTMPFDVSVSYTVLNAVISTLDSTAAPPYTNLVTWLIRGDPVFTDRVNGTISFTAYLVNASDPGASSRGYFFGSGQNVSVPGSHSAQDAVVGHSWFEVDSANSADQTYAVNLIWGTTVGACAAPVPEPPSDLSGGIVVCPFSFGSQALS